MLNDSSLEQGREPAVGGANAAAPNAPSAAKVEVQVKTSNGLALPDFDKVISQQAKAQNQQVRSDLSSATKRERTYELTMNSNLPHQNYGRTKYQKYSDYKKKKEEKRNEAKRPTEADVQLYEQMMMG